MSDPVLPAVPEKLRRWLEWAVQVGASDLHLIVGYPPVLRLNGDLTELPEPVLVGGRGRTASAFGLPAGCPSAVSRHQERGLLVWCAGGRPHCSIPGLAIPRRPATRGMLPTLFRKRSLTSIGPDSRCRLPIG